MQGVVVRRLRVAAVVLPHRSYSRGAGEITIRHEEWLRRAHESRVPSLSRPCDIYYLLKRKKVHDSDSLLSHRTTNEGGPEELTCVKMEAAKPHQQGGSGPWDTIIQYWGRYSRWCRDMNLRRRPGGQELRHRLVCETGQVVPHGAGHQGHPRGGFAKVTARQYLHGRWNGEGNRAQCQFDAGHIPERLA